MRLFYGTCTIGFTHEELVECTSPLNHVDHYMIDLPHRERPTRIPLSTGAFASMVLRGLTIA